MKYIFSLDDKIMDISQQNYIYHILVLKEFLGQLFGSHYPREIIQLIILATYHSIKVICGNNHNILLHDKIYVWGRNNYGQLGLGHDTDLIVPQEFRFFRRSDVIQIDCGDDHTIALMRFNKCYVWGNNEYGELGLGDNNNRTSPQELVLPGKIISVCCGNQHTTALVKIGSSQKCYVWGYNGYGQLGLGDTNHKKSPQELSLLNIITVYCGGYHTIALTDSGILYSWGGNGYGQLGLGHKIDTNLPQEINFIFEPIASVAFGDNHIIVLTTNNKIYVWGYNYFGQLGLGHYAHQYSPQELILPNIISVSCGGDFTTSLTSSGKIYGWGFNGTGRLGRSFDSI